MSDGEEEKKRPNANYKLSNEKIGGEEIVYHYNRERRLAKSSQAVRDMYEAKPPRRFGFLRPLVGSKSGAMLFGTIIFLCVLMYILSALGFTGDSRELDGNIVSVLGKGHEGTAIIELKKSPRKDKLARYIKTYTGAVDIAVFPAVEPGQQATDVFYHRIFFTNEREEHYRFAVPFGQGDLAIILQTEKKTLSLKLTINNEQ